MTAPEFVPETQAAGDDVFVRVRNTFLKHHPQGNADVLERAYRTAAGAHRDQFRKTGDPFILHPLEVAGLLAEYGMDEATLAAALLHDTVEDTSMTLEDLNAAFGEEVTRLIDGVTKLDRIRFRSAEEAQAATIRKMIVAMAQDVRVLLIKLADRLHNLRTIDPLAPAKQERIAAESLEIYAPLAHRLGVQEIKHEIEDRCFAILYPKRQAEIQDLLNRRAPARQSVIDDASNAVRAALERNGIKATVSGRPKHLYSIYRKMVATGRTFDEIYDIIGIRIVTADVRDCYGALGVVHTMWPPVHGRFKDYIATPKFNLYQSLHTTVVGPDGKGLEVQIRSEEMHMRAEYGVAAHWRYKEGAPEELSWMSDIRFLQETYEDPGEFLAGLKIDLYRDEVFVLTPKGDVVTLPRGATPIDFAYAIHTEVGHRCVGARVNGRLVSLSTELRSGDIVEVTTSKAPGAGPSRDWLRFVTTSRAAAKIRQWFNRERREEALGGGRELINKALAKEGLGLSASERDAMLADLAANLGFSDADAMLIAVGEGNLNPLTVVGRLARAVRPLEEEEEQDLLRPPRRRARRPAPDIIVEGQDDVWVRIARCCAPVPGDDIVGFVTVGRGVSVHRSDCTNVAAMEEKADRMIEVAWSPHRAGSFSVWLQVEALDRPRLLRDVTSTLSDLGANISASSSATDKDRVAILRFEVEFSDPGQLKRALAELRGVEGVYDAYRLVPTGDD